SGSQFDTATFDVIVGMDWLVKCDALIVCGKKEVELFLAQVTEKEPAKKQLQDMPVIRNFPEVFPDDLPGLPPPRQVEFKIKLILALHLYPRLVYLNNTNGSKAILGLAGYYRRFIEGFSLISKPLSKLTQKNKKYEWGMKEEEAFQALKLKLCYAPILALPEGTKNIIVYCDASLKGFGATDSIEKLAQLYLKEIAYRHGVPVSIISNRDSLFTSRFWKPLQEALGTQLNLSTTYHLKTDGQSERTIQTLEDMLRACVVDFGNSCDRHIPLVEFSYNNSYHASINTAPFEALYGRKCISPVCGSEVGDSQLTSPKLIQETTEMIVQIKKRLLTARSRQKSYADVRRKPMEFEVCDMVMLKVSPWKGIICFGKHGKLSPRYIRRFEIIERIGPVAYKLKLPEKLRRIHKTFHVSNLKKCLADENIVIPLEEIQLDEKLHSIEESMEIMEREVKRLKESQIPIVKVQWNSRCGPKYTWERKIFSRETTLTCSQLEEDPEEEPEEEEIEDQDMVNDEEDDAEVINPYEEVDPHNRPPLTSDEETEFAPPVVQIVDADDVPIPPVIQFGGNFHVGESSAMRDLLAGNSEVYAPGPMCFDLKSVHRG
nr:putative reverse transcriptase domain, ribonuclease H-like domain, aspartic peptidase domain protein [Tanacetum cinerariifolium]